jgi:hypothetical protein
MAHGISCRLVNKLRAFCATERFLILFKRPSSKPAEYNQNLLTWAHVSVRGFFPWDLQQNFVTIFHVHMSHPHPWFYHFNNLIFGEEYKLWPSWLRCILHPPVTSPLLGPNTWLTTLFSNSLNLCSIRLDTKRGVFFNATRRTAVPAVLSHKYATRNGVPEPSFLGSV